MPDNIYKNIQNKEIKEYEVKIPKKEVITIENYRGSISVHGWEEKFIKVNAIFHSNEIPGTGNLFNDGNEAEVYIDSNDETGVLIKTLINKDNKTKASDNFLENIFNWIGKKISSVLSAPIIYDIYVPNNFEIRCDTKNGDLFVNDFTGNVKLKTMNGKIEIDNLQGNINAITFNGRINISDVIGKLSIETYQGRIAILNSELENGSIKTMSGRITTQIKPIGPGPFKLKTMNGRIMMGVPSDSSLELLCKTVNGKVNNNISSAKKHSQSGIMNSIVLGDGEAKLYATTMNGHIYIVDFDDFQLEKEDSMEDKKNAKFEFNINIPHDSEEYQDMKEEITNALNKINEEMKELLFSTSNTEKNSTSKEHEELNEIIDKFNSFKDDFINVMNEPEDNKMSNEEKDKLSEKMTNMEKEIQEKILKFQNDMKSVDNMLNEKLNTVASSIEELSEKFKKFPKSPEHPSFHKHFTDTERIRKPGRPVRSGKNSQSEESKMILQMLKEGKITASEAEALLKALKQT